MQKLLTALCVTVMLAGMVAVAHALPVKLLPEPTAADVACGKCVNEGKLLKELRSWQKRYNTIFRAMEKKSEKELYRLMADPKGTTAPSEGLNGEGKGLEAVMEPVLARWVYDKQTPQDMKVLKLLERYGVIPDSVDEMPYLHADNNFFCSRFTIPPAAKDFVALLNTMPDEYTYGEGFRLHSDEDLAKWLMQWDLLLQGAAGQPWREAAQSRYLFWLNMLLFHKVYDISVQVDDIDPAKWTAALQQSITAHPGTLTAALFKLALDDTKGKTCVVTNAARQKILAQAKAGLSGDMGKAAAGDAAAQNTTSRPPADTPVITLTVTGTPYTIVRCRASGAADTPVWIESAPGKFRQFTVGTDLEKGRLETAAPNNTVKIYGAITRFDCSANGEYLTAVDASKNTALQELGCSENALTALDVSKNTALVSLMCSNNKLTALDVSNNTALKTLMCSENKLTALDVSKLPALETLYCEKNKLTQLRLSKAAKVKGLSYEGNPLTEADIQYGGASQANTVDSLKDISAVVYKDGVTPLTEKEYSAYMEKSQELQKADETLNRMWKQAKKTKPTQKDLREQRFWLMMRGNEMHVRLKYGYAQDRLEALLQTVQRRCNDFRAEIYYAELSEEDIRRGNIKSEEFFHDADYQYGETLEYFFYARILISLDKPHPDDAMIQNIDDVKNCSEKILDYAYNGAKIPRSITEGIYIGARDHQKALQWFEQAAGEGNMMAKIFLLAFYKEHYKGQDKDKKIQQLLDRK